MGSEMKKLRKEDLSLYYYIKDVVLSDFIELEEEVPLSYMAEISVDIPGCESLVYETLTSMDPKPTDRGRGWVYFDEFGSGCPPLNNVKEQSDRVIVYGCTVSGGVSIAWPVISDSEYMIDYLDGRVITSGTCNPKYIDYYWNYVSVVDEWAAVEAADPPVVVIDIHGTDKTGYQIGPGKKVMRKVDLHVFASDTAERNDIVEALYDGLYLKSCPLYDFPRGTVLDYDGTWNGRKDNMDKTDPDTYFDRTTMSGINGIIGNLEFHNVTSRHVSLPLLMTRSRDEVMLSDLNAYRSKISFDLVSYTEA